MEKTNKNNYELYKIIILKGFATLEDLYYLKYNEKEIELLIKSKVIICKDNKYYIGNISELYYYFDMLLIKNENQEAKFFYNKIIELDPLYKVNYFELMSIALNYNDFYGSYNYYKKLDNKNDYLYDNNLYLYLFSNIIKIPVEDINYVKELKFDDISIKDTDKRFQDRDMENDIRWDIYRNKFSLAIKKINDKAISNNRFRNQDILIKELCKAANKEKLSIEKQLKELIIDNNINEAIILLNSINKYRNLNITEKTIQKLLCVYLDICNGNIHEKKENYATNIFDAIKIENYSLALSYCQSFKKQNHIEEDSALMILLSNIVSKMKLLTNNKKKTDNNELPIYNDLLNIINNIAQNHNFQIIHVDNERSKEIINNIVSDINYIEINYFNKDIMLRYKEVTNSDNLDILIKKANNAYLNKNYELAIQLYKQILSLKDELNTEYYLKISKCYNKLGKNAQAKKYLKVINLIINNDKTEEKKKSY